MFLLLLNGLNLLYFLLFHKFSDIEAVKYLLARGMQFSILSFSVSSAIEDPLALLEGTGSNDTESEPHDPEITNNEVHKEVEEDQITNT